MLSKFEISERLACRIVGLSRSAFRRPLNSETKSDPDTALRQWLCEWAKANPRRGYRNAHAAARGDGWVVNRKKVQRLWREEGLRVPLRRRRKRVGVSTTGWPTASALNMVWALDFQFDTCQAGKPIKICSIVDEHTRESLGGLVERTITAADLIKHLSQIITVRGHPMMLRMDNGPEFISQALANWASTKTGLVFAPPGAPWKNGYIESFNGRLRDECLNLNSFYSLLHARTVINDWKDYYNQHRRHSALGYQTPNGYAENYKSITRQVA